MTKAVIETPDPETENELQAQAALSDQVGMAELREMERRQRGLTTQPFGDRASGQPLRPHLEEQPKQV
jgi:hypothetical protein